MNVARSAKAVPYPIRAMVGMALAKSMYAIPTWSRTARLVAEHPGLQAALGCTPSVYAAYRFSAKLRQYDTLLNACIARVVSKLAEANPGMGDNLAIDGSDMPAYANGQRFVSKGGHERDLSEYSDPDASRGHRSAVSTRKGGGYYGYKLHMAVDTATGLPMAWAVQTAKANETLFVPALLDTARERGANVETCAMDKGYDLGTMYDACEDRAPGRSSPSARRTRSSVATTARPDASMANGCSPVPTPSAKRPSGAARPASASPPPSGSRPTACTRSCRARLPAGASSTRVALLSSASSAGSRTSGRLRLSASVVWIAFGSTPI